MEVRYKSENEALNYNNEKYMNQKFPIGIFNSFQRFIRNVEESINLVHLSHHCKSYRIKLLEGKNENLWSARLNDKYRVEFTTASNDIVTIKAIEVIRIHPHKY